MSFYIDLYLWFKENFQTKNFVFIFSFFWFLFRKMSDTETESPKVEDLDLFEVFTHFRRPIVVDSKAEDARVDQVWKEVEEKVEKISDMAQRKVEWAERLVRFAEIKMELADSRMKALEKREAMVERERQMTIRLNLAAASRNHKASVATLNEICAADAQRVAALKAERFKKEAGEKITWQRQQIIKLRSRVIEAEKRADAAEEALRALQSGGGK